MFIIFINVFLAILGEAYSMVREKMEEEEEERKKAEKGRRKRTFGEWPVSYTHLTLPTKA